MTLIFDPAWSKSRSCYKYSLIFLTFSIELLSGARKGDKKNGNGKKIRFLLIKLKRKIKALAEKLGYSGNPLSNKLKEDNFSEKELLRIAEILNCDYKAAFVMKDTGKEI